MRGTANVYLVTREVVHRCENLVIIHYLLLISELFDKRVFESKKECILNLKGFNILGEQSKSEKIHSFPPILIPICPSNSKAASIIKYMIAYLNHLKYPEWTSV